MADALLLTFVALVGVAIAAALLRYRSAAPVNPAGMPDVGIGTVQTITDVMTIEVESVTGGASPAGCATMP